MKKLLITLLVLAMVAGVGYLGFLVINGMLNPKTLGEAVQTDGDTGSSGIIFNDVKKKLDTDADVLDAIANAKKKNKDTVGWLYIPDTAINASVLQSFDNAYYLRRNEQKEDALYGCYFADYTNNFGMSRQELSPNTVIYGHSDLTDKPEGPKFSQLFSFDDAEFARTHPIIHFSTEQQVMKWQIFAVLYTDTKLDFTKTDYDGKGLVELAKEAKARSLYDYPVNVTQEDQILTLVTCTVKYPQVKQSSQRFVVMAKLLPEGEDTAVYEQLKENANPKQPDFS